MNPREILGLPKDCDVESIRKRYRELARKHHPDRPGGDADRFKTIQRAYETLMNTDKTASKDYSSGGEYASKDYSSGGGGVRHVSRGVSLVREALSHDDRAEQRRSVAWMRATRSDSRHARLRSLFGVGGAFQIVHPMSKLPRDIDGSSTLRRLRGPRCVRDGTDPVSDVRRLGIGGQNDRTSDTSTTEHATGTDAHVLNERRDRDHRVRSDSKEATGVRGTYVVRDVFRVFETGRGARNGVRDSRAPRLRYDDADSVFVVARQVPVGALRGGRATAA